MLSAGYLGLDHRVTIRYSILDTEWKIKTGTWWDTKDLFLIPILDQQAQKCILKMSQAFFW